MCAKHPARPLPVQTFSELLGSLSLHCLICKMGMKTSQASYWDDQK